MKSGRSNLSTPYPVILSPSVEGRSNLFCIYLTPRRVFDLCPPLHNREMYSYHEGEEKERGADAPLRCPKILTINVMLSFALAVY